ncbi:MAG: hypothetical protein ACTS6P_02185 [Candidatus Hodgkinia cicadicola]
MLNIKTRFAGSLTSEGASFGEYKWFKLSYISFGRLIAEVKSIETRGWDCLWAQKVGRKRKRNGKVRRNSIGRYISAQRTISTLTPKFTKRR